MTKAILTGILSFGIMIFGFLFASIAGAQEDVGSKDTYSDSKTCAAFDTSRDVTDYSARLVSHQLDDDITYEIQVQSVHAKDKSSPIAKITLSDGSQPDFALLDDNCVCGMRVNDVEVECTHISIYSIDISRETLIAVTDEGLALTFILENGRIVAGPRFESEDIRKVLEG